MIIVHTQVFTGIAAVHSSQGAEFGCPDYKDSQKVGPKTRLCIIALHFLNVPAASNCLLCRNSHSNK